MRGELNHFQQPRSITFGADSAPRQHHSQGWNPYEMNGGNIVAYAQDDWAVIAADTRLTRSYSILKRDATKIHRLTEDTWLLTAGMYADYTKLARVLDAKVEAYELAHRVRPSSAAIAELLSKVLYSRRFFPYYAFCAVVGFEEGQSRCWGYDAVGSHEHMPFVVQGNAQQLMVPLLDNQFVDSNAVQPRRRPTQAEALEVVVDAFQSAAERDTTCGDRLEVKLLQGGRLVSEHTYPLRRD